MGFSKNPLLDPQNSRWRRSVILKIDLTLFFCRGWSDLDKISQTGADDMSTAVVEIETGSSISIWRSLGQFNVINQSIRKGLK